MILYIYGIGHHAPGEIVVDLAGQFGTFKADMGIQWQAGSWPIVDIPRLPAWRKMPVGTRPTCSLPTTGPRPEPPFSGSRTGPGLPPYRPCSTASARSRNSCPARMVIGA